VDKKIVTGRRNFTKIGYWGN